MIWSLWYVLRCCSEWCDVLIVLKQWGWNIWEKYIHTRWKMSIQNNVVEGESSQAVHFTLVVVRNLIENRVIQDLCWWFELLHVLVDIWWHVTITQFTIYGWEYGWPSEQLYASRRHRTKAQHRISFVRTFEYCIYINSSY